MELAIAPDARPACVDITRSLAVDPGGTGIHADVVIGVEVPLPWPKPVFDHPWLQAVPDLVAASPTPARVLAVVPRPDCDPHQTLIWRRMPTTPDRRRVDHGGEPAEVVRAALDGPVGEPDDDAPDFELLLCTQGSHDTCCGSDGTRLAVELEAAGVTVHRVSHTGGHRFAPTGLAFPSGRTWAYLDPGLVDRLRSGSALHDGDHLRCRGWWGVEPGPAQVAERAVWARIGAGAASWDPEIRPLAGAGAGDTTSWQVTAGASTWGVEVDVSREIPTIACRQPGGLPFKPGREYEVLGIVESA